MEYVIVDFSDGYIKEGTFYVAITRVTSGDKLFLRDFNSAYIKANPKVNQKIIDMRERSPYIFHKRYLRDPCFQRDKDDLKVGYLNVRGLLQSLHCEYINEDKNLLNLHGLILAETWLTKNDSSEQIQKKLMNWVITHREDCEDGKPHMGLLFLSPYARYLESTERILEFRSSGLIKDGNGRIAIQIVNMSYLDHMFSFIYSRKTPNSQENMELAEVTQNSDFIIGDLNLDPSRKNDKQKLSTLLKKSKIMLLNEYTCNNVNQLDHILVNKDLKHLLSTVTFFNFISDHKAIVLRMSHDANDEKILSAVKPKKNNCSESPGVEMPSKKKKKDEHGSQIVLSDTEDENIELPEADIGSLSGTNWLNDSVVDTINGLIMKTFTDIFIFSSFFAYKFIRRKSPYSQLSRFDKSRDLFKCRLVFFPLLQHSHWFLCVVDFSHNKLSILDPYVKDNTKKILKINT